LFDKRMVGSPHRSLPMGIFEQGSTEQLLNKAKKWRWGMPHTT
jgi:hypothetical protein